MATDKARVRQTCRDVCASLLLPNGGDVLRLLVQRARINRAGGVVGVNDCGEEVPLHELAQDVSERLRDGRLRPLPAPATSEPTALDGTPVAQLEGQALADACEESLRDMSGRRGV